jgi:CHASE3 domain sensor protein
VVCFVMCLPIIVLFSIGMCVLAILSLAFYAIIIGTAQYIKRKYHDFGNDSSLPG